MICLPANIPTAPAEGRDGTKVQPGKRTTEQEKQDEGMMKSGNGGKGQQRKKKKKERGKNKRASETNQSKIVFVLHCAAIFGYLAVFSLHCVLKTLAQINQP